MKITTCLLRFNIGIRMNIYPHWKTCDFPNRIFTERGTHVSPAELQFPIRLPIIYFQFISQANFLLAAATTFPNKTSSRPTPDVELSSTFNYDSANRRLWTSRHVAHYLNRLKSSVAQSSVNSNFLAFNAKCTRMCTRRVQQMWNVRTRVLVRNALHAHRRVAKYL